MFHKKIGKQDLWWTKDVNESRKLLLKEKIKKLENDKNKPHERKFEFKPNF